MKKYILSIDQGTTSSRAVLFDETTSVVGISQKQTRQIYPHPGWVEQSPDEIWNNQYQSALNVLNTNNIKADEVLAIGITNQRETTVVWDRNTGQPVYNAIIWQDKRTATQCLALKEQEWGNSIKEKTGLIIDSYFSATKLQWILEHVEGARAKAEAGDLLFGTVDTFLVWKLSGGRLHITDYSNASRTMLLDITEGCWDEKLLDLFQIPPLMLPQLVESSAVYGTTDASLFNGVPIPIASMIGDQQSALFGQLAHEAGTAKNTYGTGCFLLMNTGGQPISSSKGLLSTIAWKLNGKMEYALEGSVFIAGAVVKWLQDNLGIVKEAKQSELMAKQAGDNHGVYFVPAFAGLGAPYWDMNARAIITGLTLSARKDHIVRAALESMAYQTKDILHAMQQDSGIVLKELSVDGGASTNDFLMQFQSDLLNVPVRRPQNTESTAMGAALLAGMAVGVWSKYDMKLLQPESVVFTPGKDRSIMDQYYEGWKNAVKRCLV